MKNRYFLLLTIFQGSILLSVMNPVLDMMEAKIKDGRKHTFKRVLQLVEERHAKVIVETGTTRGGEMAFDGDGGFSIFFGYWCSLNNAKLYSVDTDLAALKRADVILRQYGDCISLVQGDSVNFLQNFHEKIDLLYLDSMDCDKDNPLPSQQHHLNEVKAVYDKLHAKSIILIDDVHPHKYPKGGKDKLAVQFLKEKGWQEIARFDQVLLIFPDDQQFS